MQDASSSKAIEIKLISIWLPHLLYELFLKNGTADDFPQRTVSFLEIPYLVEQSLKFSGEFHFLIFKESLGEGRENLALCNTLMA